MEKKENNKETNLNNSKAWKIITKILTVILLGIVLAYMFYM